MLSMEGKPFQFQQAAIMVLDRAESSVLRRLGFPSHEEISTYSSHDREALNKILWTAWKRVNKPMDPYDNINMHKRLTKSIWGKKVEMRNSERIAKRIKRLNQFNNRIILASLTLKPEDYQDAWQGDSAVDHTPMPAARNGNSFKSPVSLLSLIQVVVPAKVITRAARVSRRLAPSSGRMK